MKRKIKDERLVALNNANMARTGWTVMTMLTISVFVKTLVLNLPFEQVAVELFIYMSGWVSYIVRAVRCGLLEESLPEKKNTLIRNCFVVSLVVGLSVAGIISARNYFFENYAASDISQLFSVIFAESSILGFLSYYFISQFLLKRRAKHRKELEDEDE